MYLRIPTTLKQCEQGEDEENRGPQIYLWEFRNCPEPRQNVAGQAHYALGKVLPESLNMEMFH